MHFSDADFGACHVAERLHDELGLLAESVGVQLLVLAEQLERGTAGHIGVVGDRACELDGLRIAHVVGEGVHNEALLYRLAHRVDVERVEGSVRPLIAEHLERLLLRRGGKGNFTHC